MGSTIANAIGFMMVVCLAFCAGVLLAVIPVWLLWNWLMPVVFGLPVLTFWQSLGMLVLSGLLFKSWSYKK